MLPPPPQKREKERGETPPKITVKSFLTECMCRQLHCQVLLYSSCKTSRCLRPTECCPGSPPSCILAPCSGRRLAPDLRKKSLHFLQNCETNSLFCICSPNCEKSSIAVRQIWGNVWNSWNTTLCTLFRRPVSALVFQRYYTLLQKCLWSLGHSIPDLLCGIFNLNGITF